MRKFATGAGAALLLAGCSSISKEECVYADWGAIGYEDGAAGRPVSAVSPRRSICARKAGVTVDMAAYLRGRERGLETYCQPSNGYALGSRGGTYYGVCAEHGEQQFSAAFDVGRQLFILESDLASINGRIQQAQYDLRGIEHSVAETEVALVTPGRPVEDRIKLLANLKQLTADRKDIEIALDRLHHDRGRAEAQLEDYREDLAYSGGWRGVVEPADASF